MSAEQQKQASLVERTFLRISPNLKYWGFHVASNLSGVVPLKVSYFLAVTIGDYIYYTWHEHSANAISNMRRVLGPGSTLRQAKRAARESIRNYAKSLVDFVRFPHVTQDEVIERVTTGGWEVIDAALAEGKGVLALSGHIGNWDFAGAALGMRHLEMHAIADTFEPPKLDALVKSTRERNGVHIVPLGGGTLRAMLQALKRNELVLLLMDRPMAADEGVRVTFFGEEAYLPSGPAAIALKSGASLVTAALVRMPGDMKFSGSWEAIHYRHLITGDEEADIQAVTQQIAHALEGVIARNPDQWYMFRPMWPRLDISRAAARQERRELRGAQTGNSKIAPSNGRGLLKLGARLRRKGRIDVVAMGISVDPPEMENWARGEYPHGAEAAPGEQAPQRNHHASPEPVYRPAEAALAPDSAPQDKQAVN